MDRLQSMKVFERVATEGGFAAAARALDLSPAVVTRLVADLEAHLGTRLLQRSTRRVSLTDSGSAYLVRVRHILADLDEAETLARASTAELSGTLRLFALTTIATHALAPMVAAFRTAHPRIVVDLTVGTVPTRAIEGFDIAFSAGDAAFEAHVVARKLIDAEFVLVASPTYLATRGLPRDVASLAAHDALRLRAPGPDHDAWRLFPDGGGEAVEVAARTVLRTDHVETLLHAAIAGAGIASLPRLLAQAPIAQGALVPLLEPWRTGTFPVWAALPSRRFLPRRTRAFLDFVVAQLDATLSRPAAAG